VVRNLIIASVFLYSFEILIIVFAFWDLEIVVLLNTFLYIAIIVIVYIIGYDALVRKKNEIIKYIYIEENLNTNSSALSDIIKNNNTETRRKYEKNALTELKSTEISKKISISIEKVKPYRNPELRLTDFAELIDEHPNNVSQVLNDVLKKNFYDFINFYRIEEAKLLLKSPYFNNYTITAIGFEVGFNSKTSFYSAFKKFANTTPAQFQKSNSIELQ
jgi:AraC-like DNA-binding protein